MAPLSVPPCSQGMWGRRLRLPTDFLPLLTDCPLNPALRAEPRPPTAPYCAASASDVDVADEPAVMVKLAKPPCGRVAGSTAVTW